MVGPFVECFADQFVSVVDDDGLGQASRLVETHQNPDNVCAGQRRLEIDGRAFSAEIVDDILRVRIRVPLDSTST